MKRENLQKILQKIVVNNIIINNQSDITKTLFFTHFGPFSPGKYSTDSFHSQLFESNQLFSCDKQIRFYFYKYSAIQTENHESIGFIDVAACLRSWYLVARRHDLSTFTH